MRESAIAREILLALGNEPDLSVWRQNTGALADVTGRVVRFGLALGSSDIIGILAPSGRMIALEVKVDARPSRVTEDQINWGNVIRSMGGVYEIVTSKAEAVHVLKEARAGRI